MTTPEPTPADTPEGDVSNATPEGDIQDAAPEGSDLKSEPDSFPRTVVEDLRKENAKYRQRAGQADTFAQRLHLEIVKATGRLADPTDLPFDESHIDDPDALTAAVDELLAAKPHLASRKPVGDIGQGQRGGNPQPVSLLGLLRERA
ncbi:hypothetical protein BH09ACT7_BH09ACT7_32400 [soil metagenome]